MYTISKSDKERILMGLTTGLAWAKDTAANVNSINHAIELINNLPTQAQPTAGEVQEAIERCLSNENYGSEHPFEWAQFRIADVKKIIQAAQSNDAQYWMNKWQDEVNTHAEVMRDNARLRGEAQSQNAAGLVATSYAIEGEERYNIELRISNGQKKWCVKYGNDVLNKKGEWEYEPMPSGRTEYFIQNTRFDTPQDALATFRENKGGKK